MIFREDNWPYFRSRNKIFNSVHVNSTTSVTILSKNFTRIQLRAGMMKQFVNCNGFETFKKFCVDRYDVDT